MLHTSTSLKWPAYILRVEVRSVLHNRAVLSRLAVAKYIPRGLHCTSQTGFWCPR